MNGDEMDTKPGKRWPKEEEQDLVASCLDAAIRAIGAKGGIIIWAWPADPEEGADYGIMSAGMTHEEVGRTLRGMADSIQSGDNKPKHLWGGN